MIEQKVQVNISSVFCNFGENDVAVSCENIPEDKERVYIKLENTQDVENDYSKLRVLMVFNSVESLNALKTVVENAIDILNEKNETPDPEFIVPYGNILVRDKFVRHNPAATKVMECMKKFQETGEIDRDIIVDENICIKDGYVGYLVAGYNNVKKVKVVSKNGIKAVIHNKIITFKSNKIAISYNELRYDSVLQSLILENCGEEYKFFVKNIDDAMKILSKIESIFEGEYSVCEKSPLYKIMKDLNMNVKAI